MLKREQQCKITDLIKDIESSEIELDYLFHFFNLLYLLVIYLKSIALLQWVLKISSFPIICSFLSL